MLAVIMKSGVIYKLNWTLYEFYEEIFDEENCLINGFVEIFSDVVINPHHIASIEVFDD
ncbi:hypothetical protein [Alkalihalobacterium elongatum]|uniref:hypothetical protein n=1 Tax=Alkalihalobacterium elongatum TaxID=2675466 RepID=UPI001C1FBAC4|nr:hypothetical protein [Alkalihalobacterium elongatum]